MAQINIKLTDDQKPQISDIAKERGISITQLVISSILDKEKFYTYKDGIESREEGMDSKEKDKELKSIAGCYSIIPVTVNLKSTLFKIINQGC